MNLTNRQAFRDAIAYSEIGPELLKLSDNGYNVVVGSTPANPVLFHTYDDHPRQRVWLPAINVWSTAAGRYQILARYFDAYKDQLSLAGFGPVSQDKIAMQLIGECKALDDIDAGRFEAAMGKCKTRWASLPNAGFGQHENKMETLQAAYLQSGGTLA